MTQNNASRPHRGWTRRTLNLSLLAAVATPACAAESNAQRSAAAQSLRRGIGVHNVLNWAYLESGSQRRFVWPPFEDDEHQISDEEIANLRSVGFDFIRLTIGPELFMATRGARSRELSAILRAKVERFRAAGLNVLVDLHPTYNSDPYNPERIVNHPSLFQRYVEIVRQIAGVLHAVGEGVVLELMNEPPVANAARWRTMVVRMVEAVRTVAPALPLVVPGHDGDGYLELCAFDPLPASMGPIIYTFHYYEPGIFTHQTQIDVARHITGLEWPPEPQALASHIATANRNVAADPELNPLNRGRAREEARLSLEAYYERNHNAAAIAAAFAEVAAWADLHGVPRANVLLGEFGVVRTHWDYVGAKEPSRLAWLEAVRREAENNGFGWAVWTYRGWGGMAITNRENVLEFEPGTMRALGLAAD